MSIRDDAEALHGEIAELRHAVHREPEIGLSLPRAQVKVLTALDGLPLEIHTGRQLTSVTAVLPGCVCRFARVCWCGNRWEATQTRSRTEIA